MSLSPNIIASAEVAALVGLYDWKKRGIDFKSQTGMYRIGLSFAAEYFNDIISSAVPMIGTTMTSVAGARFGQPASLAAISGAAFALGNSMTGYGSGMLSDFLQQGAASLAINYVMAPMK